MNETSRAEDTATWTHTASELVQATSGAEEWYLVLLWSRHEGDRTGQSARLARSATLGRGPAGTPGLPPKLEFGECRPQGVVPRGALEAPTLSRSQCVFRPQPTGVAVENHGKRGLLHNGVSVRSAVLREGGTLGVDGVLTVILERRAPDLSPEPATSFGFGEPDADGLVGESPAAWRLRGELARIARRDAHVLILGESGTGKELSARALHRLSSRSREELVARNAATIPDGLAEAELFGNVANYPQAGMKARDGLVGQAGRSTLFLDEIGELPEKQQANLLRLLDGGEYQRLGEDRTRRSHLRMVGATNRPVQEMKDDVAARFQERVDVPGLGERRSDIPLIARELLRSMSDEENLRLDQALADSLVRHSYRLHVRELGRLLSIALRRRGPGGVLTLTSEVQAEVCLPEATSPPLKSDVQLVLAESSGVAEAARRLGMSRYALYRLMKKLGLNQASG